jgi:hypothetical protein
MSKAVGEWTNRRLDDMAAALEPVPARVAVLEARVDHLTAQLDSVPAQTAVLAATAERLAEDNRLLRVELATMQGHLLQMSCALVAALLGGAAAIIAALI